MNNSGKSRTERPSLLGIQYLRGIAALMVVFHHATHYITDYLWSGIGATGVDIFFVISGFIMAYSSTRDQRPGESQTLTASDFFVRRCVRVIPLYWVALAISWRTELMHGALSLDMVKDFLFIPRFFAPDVPKIWPKLVPGWTINCEMFFYLVFGLAILLSRHRLRLTLIVLCVLSVAGVWLQPRSAPAQFYSWSVFLEFAFGIALYVLYRWRPVHLPGWIRLGILVAAVAALAYAARNNAYEYSRIRFLVYGVPAFFIVWVGLQVRQSRELPLLKLLGDASYSIYLFHATIGIRVAFHVLNALRIVPSNWFSVTLALSIYLAISTVIGILIHWILEKPMLSHLRRWSDAQLLKLRGHERRQSNS